MRNRGLRIALAGLVLLTQSAGAWMLWTSERERTAVLDAAREFETSAQGLLALVSELRAAQRAYVAEGQGNTFWFGQVTTMLGSLQARLADARARSKSPEAGQALDAAANLLSRFAKSDEQVRALLRSDQRLMASDLIFGDSAETSAACAARIEEAAGHEVAAERQRLRELKLTGIGVLAVAGGVGIMCLLLLVPRGRASERPATLSIIDSSSPPAAPPPARPPAPVPTAGPDLGAVAKLCAEFSRVGDPSMLPSLMEQTASILHASGLVVWMANPTTRALRPVLSHGYGEQALARIGELAATEDNATAEAFRTGESRIVEGDGATSGAIVVPLATPAGCVGVLAAEIRHGGETDKANQAIATIIAAQLASLVPSSPAAS